jgi:hypothetical protein
MRESNTLAYYDTATITDIKSFVTSDPGASNIKLFMAVMVAIL